MAQSNKNMEFELTYLAAKMPDGIEVHPSTELIDIYIPENPAVRANLRLRKKGDKYEITKKIQLSESDVSIHEEQTIPLDELEFLNLSSKSMRRVIKNRVSLPIGGHNAEIDIFQDSLKGLVLVDFEFETEEEMGKFTPPDVCLADVTQERFIAGGELAGKTYSDIEVNLDRFGYKPL